MGRMSEIDHGMRDQPQPGRYDMPTRPIAGPHHLYCVDASCASMKMAAEAVVLVAGEFATLFDAAGVHLPQPAESYTKLLDLANDVRNALTCRGCHCLTPVGNIIRGYCPGCWEGR